MRSPNRSRKSAQKPATQTNRWLALLRLPVINELLSGFIIKRLILQGENGDMGAVLALSQIISQKEYQTHHVLAGEYLKSLKNRGAISKLWEEWLKNRNLHLQEVLLKINLPAQTSGSAKVFSYLLLNKPFIPENEDIPGLIHAFDDKSAGLTILARKLLISVKKQTVINIFCQTWSKNRSEKLKQIILDADWVASSPVDIHILTLLVTNKINLLKQIPPLGLPVLLEFTKDSDLLISQRASETLLHLENPDTRDALCRAWIETENPSLISIISTANYLPTNPEQQALFYFIGRQWEKLIKIDFDLRYMKLVYKAEPDPIRKKIIATIQSAGKSNYLEIISDIQPNTQSKPLSRDEYEIMARIFTQNQEWDRLWELCFNSFPDQSLYWNTHLFPDGWEPKSESDRHCRKQLIPFLSRAKNLDGSKLFKNLPTAIHRATLTVRGRVNDIAFSPTEDILSIATGEGRLVIWDYQKGIRRDSISNFNHPCNRVAFLPDGKLVIGEKGKIDTQCGLYLYFQAHIRPIGYQRGSITAILPYRDNFILTAGRDGFIRIWDTRSNQTIGERQFNHWPRSIAISKDQSTLAVLFYYPHLIRLPNLDQDLPRPILQRKNKPASKSIISCAGMDPDASTLIVGYHSGRLRNFSLKPGNSSLTDISGINHQDTVRNIQFFNKKSQWVSAGAEGVIHFISSSTGQLERSVSQPGGRLTRMILSPGESILATGQLPSKFLLWDLRIQDLPDLLNKAIAGYSQYHLNLLRDIVDGASLSPGDQLLLSYLITLLEHNFRYTIEIDDQYSPIKPGEFDIIVN